MEIKKEKIIDVLNQEKNYYIMLLEAELKEQNEDISRFKDLCNTYSRIDILISVIMEQEEYNIINILTSVLIEALHRNDYRIKDVLLKTLKTIEL